MKRNEQQEIELSKFIDKVKTTSQKAMDSSQTAEELQQTIASLCLNCYLPKNSECEICSGHCKDQLFINFESLEEKPKRHDWDWDND